jgi:hypothetical protein
MTHFIWKFFKVEGKGVQSYFPQSCSNIKLATDNLKKKEFLKDN